MDLQSEVNSYLEAMREIKESINQLQGERFLENHKKTLLFSLLETISKGVYGDKFNRNFPRFKNFLQEFCGWEDSMRVSLQQLALLLEKTKEKEFKRLKEHVLYNLTQYPMASPVPFSYDSTVEEIKELMPKGETVINGVDIYSLTHINLLWKYRNSLVNEARSIGSNELFDFVDYPHYVHFTTLEEEWEWEVWKICYPISFFNNLVEIALAKSRIYLIENKQNPRKNYSFDELWIKPKSGNLQ